MIPPNAQQSPGIGIVIGELGMSASRFRLSGQSEQIVDSDHGDPPPSVLLPRFAREPRRLDRAEPGHACHLRGSGCDWPPESQVDDQSGSGRFPVALAWAELPENQKWTWIIDNYPAQTTPAEAIATAAAHILSRRQNVQSHARPALVIPNTTREESQQAILNEARRLKIEVQLLWRPVAAALAWCNQFDSNLREILSSRGHQTDETLGHLVCLHLGIAEIEATILELVIQEKDGGSWIVPARDRRNRDRQTTPSPGWLALKTSASEFLSAAKLPADRQHLWQLLFATNWVRTELSATSVSAKPAVGTFEMPSGAILDLVRPRPISLANLPNPSADHRWHVLGPHSLPEVHPDSLNVWQSNVKNDLPNTVLGVVVTGEIASVPMPNGQSLAQFLLDDLRLEHPPLAVIGPAESDRLLAHGAAIFSARLAAGLPTYLDTLPQLQLFICRPNGELHWEDLLEARHEYVDGGREWIRPKPVSGLEIEKNSTRLTLAIYHEEFPKIRESIISLPSKSDDNVPVELQVSITPAQGNARLEVCPARKDHFGTRRLRVDWSRMEVVPEERGGDDPKEYTKKYPRPFPEIMPRLSSRRTWCSARCEVLRFLDADERGRAYHDRDWDKLKRVLRQPDTPKETECGYEVRAVSSDGEVDEDPGLLARLIDRLQARLRRVRNAQTASHIVRCLAYASANHPDFSHFLIDEIARIMAGAAPTRVGTGHAQRSYRDAVLLACGNCLRAPEQTQLLARHFVSHFHRGGKNYRDWLQAMQAILRYRKAASHDFDPNECLAIVDLCSTLLQEQLNLANRNETPHPRIFALAARVVAFLLRRRAFDPDFLAPESGPAIRVKKACMEVMELVKGHEATIKKLEHAIENPATPWTAVKEHKHKIAAHKKVIRAFVGGARDAREALQQIIDYVDRRGIDLLKIAAPDEDE